MRCSEFDNERDCQVLDEDPLLDDLEEVQKEGGKLFEYHGAELFPERWFNLVIVLTTGISNRIKIKTIYISIFI